MYSIRCYTEVLKSTFLVLLLKPFTSTSTYWIPQSHLTISRGWVRECHCFKFSAMRAVVVTATAATVFPVRVRVTPLYSDHNISCIMNVLWITMTSVSGGITDTSAAGRKDQAEFETIFFQTFVRNLHSEATDTWVLWFDTVKKNQVFRCCHYHN